MALDACNPVLLEIDDSCGCAVTKATLKAVSPEDLNSDDWKETGIARVYASVKEGRLCGVQEKPLIDLFLSRLKPKKRGNLGESGQASLIAPYFLEPSPAVINANYFLIGAGAAVQASARQWSLTITNSESEWATDLPAIERYFLPGQYVVIHYTDANGIGRTITPKVISAVNADIVGTHQATVVVEANYTLAGFNALDAADQAVFQPTHGVVQLLANSVSDRESWCHNKPSNINWKWRDFWWQTIRNTHCVNDEYIKALQAPLLSDYFRKFRSLPLAQQRKQHQALAEKEFFNTVFFGDRINENQTVQTYTDLEKVYDPADADCVIELKANTIGVLPQLSACSRVVDFGGGALDMDEILTNLKTLARYRGEATGANIVRIEAMTDQATLAGLRYKFISYLKDKYGITDINIFYQPGQKVTYTLTGRVIWNYDLFMFLDDGLELAVITDFAFDDHLRAFPTADKSAGRYFFILDWSDIDIYLAGAKSVTRQTNVADDLYKCVIDPVVTRYLLESKTIATCVHDPNRHLVYKNFSANCPKLTATVCTEYE